MSNPADKLDKPAEVWPKKVTLKYPIDYAGEIVGVLEFRRGKLGHLNGIELTEVPPVDKLLLIASRMCGQPVALLELVDAEDGLEVVQIALDFFVKCLGAGKTS